eukprot:603378-Karenia_brevis.AAC.1
MCAGVAAGSWVLSGASAASFRFFRAPLVLCASVGFPCAWSRVGFLCCFLFRRAFAGWAGACTVRAYGALGLLGTSERVGP